MKPGINNYSEIGKLYKVLLHRLGGEIEGLVPDNFERILFDDIPYLKIAQQEHDRFAELLRENGVEVIYYVDETAKLWQQMRLKRALSTILSLRADCIPAKGRSHQRLSAGNAVKAAG